MVIKESRQTGWPPILVTAGVQAALYFLGMFILPHVANWTGMGVPFFWQMVAQGLLAGLLTYLLRFSMWWVVIQGVAPPLLVVFLILDPPVWVYPVLVGGLLLVFWNVAINRVPLYLTNRATADCLHRLLPKRAGLAVADLGSGFGGTLRVLSLKRRNQTFFGLETAPVPWGISILLNRLAGAGNYRILFQDIWKQDLSGFDVVYCFLSPVPMPALYEKAKKEMKPGSLFISNSFTVPDVPPDRTLTVEDSRKTTLMIWTL
ncbi:class I SAM-dependent methyltransferase [Sneathiella chinensis]|nr:class I SAM-dependent methyltransferase [Sneathiella chinensis]